jgi:hypothetical protein
MDAQTETTLPRSAFFNLVLTDQDGGEVIFWVRDELCAVCADLEARRASHGNGVDMI